MLIKQILLGIIFLFGSIYIKEANTKSSVLSCPLRKQNEKEKKEQQELERREKIKLVF